MSESRVCQHGYAYGCPECHIRVRLSDIQQVMMDAGFAINSDPADVIRVLRETVGEREAQILKLRRILKELEWAGEDFNCGCYCLYCRSFPDTGHTKRCELAAALGDLAEQPRCQKKAP